MTFTRFYPGTLVAIVVVLALVAVMALRRRPAPQGEPADLGLEGLEHDPAGFDYVIVKEGTGPNPMRGDRVNVHYTGWLTDGRKFDSSRDRRSPFKFILGRGEVIKGWDEGVARMKVGEVRKLVIPPELGYGQRSVGPIPAGSTLVFEVELLEIEDLHA